jgi:hypothetical protein
MRAHEIPLGYPCGTDAVGVREIRDQHYLAGIGLRVDLDALHERLDQLVILEIDRWLRGQAVEAGELLERPLPQFLLGEPHAQVDAAASPA